MRLHLAAALACACSLAPAGARAADVVVLTLGGDAPEAQARLAREAVAAALTREGSAVLPEADVAMRVAPSRLAACRAAECAYAIARELEVPTVAAVTLWMEGDAPGSLTVSLIVGPERSHSAREAVGDRPIEEAARAAVEAARAAQRRALLVEGATSGPVAPPDEEDPDAPTRVETPETSPLRADRSLEEWILPSLLGVVGLTLVGLSVYALLEEQCDVRGPSGVCLRGTAPNVGLGVTFSVTGVLAIAGAIVWLVVGGSPPSVGNVDVVIGPDGGGLAWRGQF